MADRFDLFVHVFDIAQHFGNTRFEMPRVNVAFGEHLARLGRNDFEPALAHDRMVDVVELGAFANHDRLVELDFNAGAVAEPLNFANRSDRIAADHHLVFGLQGTELVEIDLNNG